MNLPPRKTSVSPRLLVFSLCLLAVGPNRFAAADEPVIRYGAARQLATLTDGAIDESSGVACSHRHADLFFTHNDSGDLPRLYAFDSAGKSRGTFAVPQADALDWEDIASFEREGKPYLMIADVGDNWKGRASVTLYLVAEPEPEDKEAKLLQTVRVAYEGGPINCEAVAVDPTSNQVLLASKEKPEDAVHPPSRVFLLAWPEGSPKQPVTVKKIGEIRIPAVTAMDISPDGRRAVVLTYAHAYEFLRGEKETWADAFTHPSRRLEMPFRRQGESICYGPDGKTLYLTSEHTPTPLFEVPVAAGQQN